MKPSRTTALLLATALLIAAATTSFAAGAAGPVEIPGELIVKFKLGSTAATRAAALLRVPSSTRLREFSVINAELVHFTGMSTGQAIAQLQEDPLVVYAEPNYEIHLDAIPNDPRFPELWGMRNVGQTGGTPGADIRATLAWDQFTGDANLKVGVIDTGVDWTHPDLAANIWTNPGEIAANGIDDDLNGYVDDIHGYDFVNNDGNPMDDNGHGTHCSGTIAGVGNNGVGVAGVNWQCKIVGIKFLDAGGGGSTAGAIASVQYAIAAGVRLTSNSWGGGGFSLALLDAINAAGGSGQLFVAAAGNAGSDSDVFPQYPAAYDSPFIISVAATDHNDQLAGFSNWGLTSVDLGAPGVDILSCVPGGGYTTLSGTSMATPHVAGAVALVRGRFPDATNLQVKELILSSADTIPSLGGRVLTGGRLNVFRAIEIPDSIPPGAIADLATGETGSTAMELTWAARGDDGDSGRVARYDIRYSTSPIDTGNYVSATPAPGGGPVPVDPGSPQAFDVTGLDFNTTYFFALKAVDEFGNMSELSNVVTGTTLGVPHMAVSPASFTQALLTGGTANQTLTVFNTGAGRLDFTAPTPALVGFPPRQWLGVTPSSGRIPAGGSMELTVSFDATALFGGDYLGNVRLLGNDPDLPQLAVPATLHVTGAPDIAMSTDSLDYGQQFIGTSRVDSVVVRNAGTDLLSVTSVTVSPADFSVPSSAFDLAPGASRVLPVAFTPASAAVLTGALVLASNDHDEGIVTIRLRGEGLVPPDVSLAPDSLAAALLTGEITTRTVTITNSGGSDLVFEASVLGVPLAPATAVTATSPPPAFHQALHGPTLNQTHPHAGAPVVQALYTGTHMHFGITEYGEIMPCQFPLGNEHLAHGAFISGYTLAYVTGGVDHVVYAVHDGRTGITPVSYQEVENTPTRVVVEVVTRTFDDVLTVRRRFTFLRDRQYVRVESSVENSSGAPVDQVVLKEAADWDVDGNFNDTWDYDHARNMVYAWSQRYVAIAANRTPEFMDMYGWNDYSTRATIVDFPVGPVANLDGMEVLHFELGPLGPAQSSSVTVAYGAAQSLVELQAVMDEGVNTASWLTVSPANGMVPAGESRNLLVTFNATGLIGGDYRAQVHVASNDPDESDLAIPAALHVTGAPDIALSADSLDYGAMFIGASRVDSVVVRNAGTDLLSVTSVTISPADFTVPATPFDLAPGASHVLRVVFAPTSATVITGALVLASNDHDEGIVTIHLAGEGLVPPDVSLAPDSLTAALLTGEIALRTMTITNSGGSDLHWSTASGEASVLASSPVFGSGTPAPGKAVLTSPPATPVASRLYRGMIPASSQPTSSAPSAPTIEAGTLEAVLENLNAGFSEITAAIPGRYDFSEGEFGNSIGDGGDDMYDGGNFLSTELGGLNYSNNAILPSPTFGAGGRYFTRKYPGLFLLVADQQGVNAFAISGNLGADGSGNVDGSILQISSGGVTYRAFVKRVYNAFDPSVNHMVIVADEPGATHEFSTNTNDDYHQVSGLAASRRIYYLLYAGQSGGYIDDASALEIFSAFLRVLRPTPDWLTVTPDSGVTAPGQSSNVQVTFNAAGLFGGDYRGAVHVLSNDPDEPDLAMTAALHVTGAPDIALSADSLDYGALFIGASRVDSVVVTNAGTDLLSVTSVTISPADFTVPATPFDLAPGASRVLRVVFAPTSATVIAGALVLASNDHDEGIVTIQLAGEGLVPPDVSLAPDSLTAALLTGEIALRTLTITNSGGSDLHWTTASGEASVLASSPVFGAGILAPDKAVLTAPPARPSANLVYHGGIPAGSQPASPAPSAPTMEAGALEAALENLNAGFSEITAAIPGRYDFSEGEFGNSIGDGGDDMYDGGNFLSTELGGLNYSNNTILPSPTFGTGGRYFTRKYPGLFLLVAEQQGVNSFAISGDLGADGGGSVDGSILQISSGGVTYRAFVKRVYNAFDPSVNHMVIVADEPGATHEFSTYTNDDYHQVSGLAASRRIYYLLYAGQSGGYIDDASALEIFSAFLRVLRPTPDWLTATPDSGVTAPGQSSNVQVTFNAAGLFGGDYRGAVHVLSNDPDEPDLAVTAALHVTGAPDIAVAPDSLNYGTLFVGQSRVDSVVVANTGTDLLTVTSVTATPGEYLVWGGGFGLPPGASHALFVTFAPRAPGGLPGSLVIASDDPSDPSVTVALLGAALLPPVVAVEPDSLSFALLVGANDSATLTVTNDGESALTFDVTRVLGPGSALSPPATAASRELSEHVPPAASGAWSGGPIPGQRLEDLGAGAVSAVSAGGTTLVISGTDVSGSIQRALGELGEVYDYVFTTNFAAIDYSPYSTVIVGLSGGTPSEADVQALATAASAGRHLILFGGTNWGPYYTGLRNHLLGHTGEEGWTTTPPPHLRLVSPGDPLAGGLPSEVTYADFSTSYYMLRISDSAAVVVARNGHDWPALVHKPIGTGSLVYFTNSPYSSFWSNAADYAVFKQILENALAGAGTSWLSVNPAAGTVAPHSSMELMVGADATDLVGGTYRAQLNVQSNDPVRPQLSVPVSLVVTGAPNITVSRDTLLYAATYIGLTRVDTVAVTNTGTDLLAVSHMITSPAYYSAPTAGFDLSPGESHTVPITFQPTRAGVLDGTIVFYSNDPDAAALVVRFDGLGVAPPVVAVVPDALNAVMGPDEILDQGLVIENHGPTPLSWSIQVGVSSAAEVVHHQSAAPSSGSPPNPAEKEQGIVPDPGPLVVWTPAASPASAPAPAAAPTLAVTLAGLDAGFASVTAHIPSRFDFSEGEIGTLIADGGNDMYDGGNTLATNAGGPVPYSNGVIAFAPAFGANYFTRKYPGLFVLVADLASVSTFTIDGNLGADGLGSVDGSVLEIVRGATHFRGFVKRVFGAGDPSVNHLIILADAPGVLHGFASSTDSDFDLLAGLSGVAPVTRLYYLLFARTSGGYVDNVVMLDIMGAFLDIVGGPPAWLSVIPSAGTVAGNGSMPLTVRYDSHGLGVGPYGAQVNVLSNDPFTPLVSVPVTLAVSTTSTAGVEGEEAPRFALQGALPNPPGRDLSVAFSLPDAEPATLDLLDLAGRRVRSIDVGARGAGRHVASLGRAGPLPSGVYLIRLKRAGHSLVTKCVVMR